MTDRRAQIAATLREAIAVLDEPYHREAVAAIMEEAAAELARADAEVGRLTRENELLRVTIETLAKDAEPLCGADKE